MEFFNNTKNFGLMITILAVVDIVFGVIGIVKGGFSIAALGGILSPIVMVLAGVAIFSQTNGGIISFAFPEGSRSKFGALTGFIFAVGLSYILSLNIVSIILGILILIVGWIITNDTKTFVDSIIWVVLIVLFALIAISSIIVAFTGDVLLIISGVCSAIIYLTAFIYLLDPEVKKKLV
ncbi:MAG: hypothetical protein J6V08_05815 [Candidatus Methanomethylophilaceae archaeon]|nr:hypothetical protein [Candidatus Methanomethylophilaceae archaeon]